MDVAFIIALAFVMVAGFIVGVLIYARQLKKYERLQQASEDQLRRNEDQQTKQTLLLERQERLCARVEQYLDKLESRLPPASTED